MFRLQCSLSLIGLTFMLCRHFEECEEERPPRGDSTILANILLMLLVCVESDKLCKLNSCMNTYLWDIQSIPHLLPLM